MTRVAMPVYENVDMLDVTGPYEMMRWAGIEVDLLAVRPGMIGFRDGFRFEVTQAVDDAAAGYDALWVPGGDPAALACMINDPAQAYIGGITRLAGVSKLVCSVCEGALLLAAAGLLDGYRATTHWAFKPCLKAYKTIAVARGHPRFVHDRDRLTGGGISAGLDETLKLIELLEGADAAREVQRTTQYYPKPPVSSRIPPAKGCPLPAPGTVDCSAIIGPAR